MEDPSYELLLAVLAALKASPEVTAIVPAGSIYPDDAPADAVPPYIVTGDSDAHQEDASCVSAQGVFLTLHVWSWGANEASNSTQARRIGNAVKRTLHDKALPLNTNKLVSIEHRRTQIFKDRDGIKNHGIMEFWASVEAA